MIIVFNFTYDLLLQILPYIVNKFDDSSSHELTMCFTHIIRCTYNIHTYTVNIAKVVKICSCPFISKLIHFAHLVDVNSQFDFVRCQSIPILLDDANCPSVPKFTEWRKLSVRSFQAFLGGVNFPCPWWYQFIDHMSIYMWNNYNHRIVMINYVTICHRTIIRFAHLVHVNSQFVFVLSHCVLAYDNWSVHSVM